MYIFSKLDMNMISYEGTSLVSLLFLPPSGNIHRGPMLNNIIPRLNNVQYMSIIDMSLGYHNSKLDEKLLYLTTSTCPFGQYQYH